MALAVILSSLVGLSLGLLGGGGSILMVPILVSVAGLPAKTAIATSLLVVGVASLGAIVEHARRGRVRYGLGLGFGVAGMVGAYAGARVATRLPAELLLGAFALMMAATGAAMIRGRRVPAAPAVGGPRPVLRIAADGVAVGFVTGLVGAGGGFLVVPALVLLGGLPMHEAVATSLMVVAMKSFAGFAGYLGHVPVDLRLAGAVAASAAATALVGGRLAGRVPAVALRRGFGIFVLAMSGPLLVSQLPVDVLAAARRALPIERWHLATSGAALAAVVLAFERRRGSAPPRGA